ncbi:probable LRR receptor-like serine/threonine-protein kinase At1g63430 [Rutidosis leptorrhynchoides]|uniref:probable LRR receptor-like serine/threonine-protein kinase At1g63430 n=1 Tax=Rutidosis leptorrhynchoides TaxID=125765 RepID=UPI003A9A2EF5
MKGMIFIPLMCVTLLLFLDTSGAVLPTEVHALTEFKEGVIDDPFLVLSNWNFIDSDPCNWFGVHCSDFHVRKINISGCSLKGFIAKELFQLSFLHELILHGNSLIGSIPKEIGLLKHLKVLDLGKNQLTGPIPHEIGDLVSIVKINLQLNALTGMIPAELGKLKNLLELRLDRNKLLGTVPGANVTDVADAMRGTYGSNNNALGFCRASPLKVADFSFNYLVGTIPKCLDYLPRASFQGNCIMNKDIKPRTPEQCGVAAPPAKPLNSEDLKNRTAEDKQDADSHSAKPAWLLALKVVTGVMVGSVFLAALIIAARRCKRRPLIIIPWKKSQTRKENMEIFIDTDMLKDVRRYSRHDLEIACEDFSNIIGSSSDSVVYKGNMKGGPEIAVISLCNKEEHWTSYLELYFQKEVADLARLKHENVGKLLGYCIEGIPFTRMLVFEYASNGTLSEHLHYEEGCQLSWTRRMTIIIGIAKGLKYLHTEIEPVFTISELNSSAVYLTDDFSPKLVDFESWKTILMRSENNSSCISNEEAMCVQPSSLHARHLDIQGNIYAFGVLLLEIVSGRPTMCKEKGYLVDWAKDYIEEPEKMSSVVDPSLKHFRDEDLETIREVVNICFRIRPRDKVTMEDVCTMLENKLDTTGSSELKASSLAWAEIALSS